MQFSTAVLAAGLAALVSAQTYTGAGVTPTASAPSGCATTYPGYFELSVVDASSGSSKKMKRSTSPDALVIHLNDSVLYDNLGRIGYIASNYQFQFDYGGQAGELATAGFSVCANKTLALGGSAVWYECLSGQFYNLYDEDWAAQCSAIYLEIITVSESATVTSSAAASTTTASASAVASESSDGQVEGTSVASVMSSSAAAVVSSVSAVTTSVAIVSSITDGQIQAPTSTSAIVSSVVVVSSVTSAPVVSTTAVAIVSTISDGQIQAPTSTSIEAYTGAAAMPTMAAQLLLAAAGAAVALL